MARTVIRIPFTDYNLTNNTLRNIMLSNKYKEKADATGCYWQKGDGFWMAARCFKFEFSDSEVIISAWIPNFGRELQPRGAVGNQMLEILQQIKYSIR